MNAISDLDIVEVLVKFTLTSPFMRIAIIHYHLHPGGVSRVIESQVNALMNFVEPDAITLYAGDIRGRDMRSGPAIEVYEELSFQYLSKTLRPKKCRQFFRKSCNASKVISSVKMTFSIYIT